MILLKTITTILIFAMGFLILYCMNGAENKQSFIGFYMMELVYVLAVVCIWV